MGTGGNAADVQLGRQATGRSTPAPAAPAVLAQAAGRPRLSARERAVAIRSLIVATASQSVEAALSKAVADVETFRCGGTGREGSPTAAGCWDGTGPAPATPALLPSTCLALLQARLLVQDSPLSSAGPAMGAARADRPRWRSAATRFRRTRFQYKL